MHIYPCLYRKNIVYKENFRNFRKKNLIYKTDAYYMHYSESCFIHPIPHTNSSKFTGRALILSCITAA